jgi:hypothetical protein
MPYRPFGLPAFSQSVAEFLDYSTQLAILGLTIGQLL